MLDDLLNTPQPPATPDRRGVAVFTQEWNATGDESIITAVTNTKLADDQLHAFITERGGIIPDGYTPVMVSAKYNPNAWTRDEPYDLDGKKTPAVTRGSWAYTFRIVPTATRPESRLNELLELTKKKPAKRNTTVTLRLR